jgi:hypothetical protein
MKKYTDLKGAAKQSRYWGWEAAANNLPLSEYRETIANSYGKKSWEEMTQEEKQEGLLEFNNGRKEESLNHTQ